MISIPVNEFVNKTRYIFCKTGFRFNFNKDLLNDK